MFQIWVTFFSLRCRMSDKPSENASTWRADLDRWAIFVSQKTKKTFLAFISDICPFFSALTSKISTYITATCHPAASTIKPAKPFYSQSDLPAASSIIGSSAITGSGSCRLRRLKHPERKICLFPPQTLGVHQTLRVSLQGYAAVRWDVFGVSSCVILWKGPKVAFRLRCALISLLLWRSLNLPLFMHRGCFIKGV